MGNCQDEFQNVDQFETNNDKQDALIDRSHKRIFATKYQNKVGFLTNKELPESFDNQIMHKSIAFSKIDKVEKSALKKKKIHPQSLELSQLNLKFYHSLGLEQYKPPDKSLQFQQLQSGERNFYIHEAQDRTGVIYIGQRNYNGYFHGNGILKSNTVHYIGLFYNGTKHFHGRQIYSNQVYEGQFQFDFRKGEGTIFTHEYFDIGWFDKTIIYGTRHFLNGNIYYGTFEDNQMCTVIHQKFKADRDKAFYYDAKNQLYYRNQIYFKNGELLRAKQVFRKDFDISQIQFYKKQKPIGCFFNQKIIKIEDPRYKNIIQNWQKIQKDQGYLQIRNSSVNSSQQNIVKQVISEWE